MRTISVSSNSRLDSWWLAGAESITSNDRLTSTLGAHKKNGEINALACLLSFDVLTFQFHCDFLKNLVKSTREMRVTLIMAELNSLFLSDGEEDGFYNMPQW